MLSSDRHERGSASVEFVLLIPFVMLMLLGVLQVGFYALVVHSATAAAEQGLHQTRVVTGSQSEGVARAQQAMEDAPFVESFSVQATRTGDSASVTVEANVVKVLFSQAVSVTRQGPTEVQR